MTEIYYIGNARMPTEKAHGSQIAKMCESFALKGTEVVLVVPRRLNPIKEDVFNYYSLKKNFKITRLPTLDLVKFGRLGFWIQALSFAFSVRFLGRIPKKAIIYSRDNISFFLLRNLPNKMFLEIHDEVKPGFIWRGALERANGLVFTNRFKRDKAARDFGISLEKTLIWPNAVDLELFNIDVNQSEARKKLGLPDNGFLACYIGKFKTMGREKGIREIIEAAGLLKEDDIKVVLVGGEAEDIKEGKKLAEAAGASGRLTFVPAVPWRVVPLYLKAADVLLMPFPNTRHYALAMSPRKMFEYMASGRPIIATNLPAIREILSEKEVFFLDNLSGEKIAKMILFVKGNPILAEEKASRALSLAKGLSWSQRAADILSFIRDEGK